MSVLGDNLSYTRFVVLSTARSGSSFLIQSLRSSPRIVAFGELFNPGRIGFNTPGFDNHDERLLRLRKRRPVEFLESTVFRGYADDVQAVGFKLFYDHLEGRKARPVARCLTSMKGLRVIHLNRWNLLRVLLSRRIASKTGVWGISTAEERQSPRVQLAARRCRSFFEETARLQQKYHGLFERAEVLPIVYEILAAEYERETRRVQEFLNAEVHALSAQTVVQEVRPLAESITNYRQLKARFASTTWEHFFEE